MKLPAQTIALLEAARKLVEDLSADAVLLLPEAELAWKSVRNHLGDIKLLVATSFEELQEKLKEQDSLIYLDIQPGPTPTQERMSLALLEAIRCDHLLHNAHVVVLYNGIDIGTDHPEHIDSLSVVHLGEHLERLTTKELNDLDTQVPLETLRAVVDLAVEIGAEGREGKPVGTMMVVGDSRKVSAMARPLNFNPFKGYGRAERDVRSSQVREQIKEIAQMDGGMIIHRDGVCESACMLIEPGPQDVTLSKGFGTRHAAAAGVTKATRAIAIVVSQSSGTVRIFQNGEVVLTIEALKKRPMVWANFHLEAAANGGN